MSTASQRVAWAPACKPHPGTMAGAYRALDDVLRRWKYAPEKGITGAYNCRQITGGSNYSLHAYSDGAIFTFWNGVRVTMALAVDINWSRNPYGPRLITDMDRRMVDEICAIRTGNGVQLWGWGGYYAGNKDAMHFEVRCTPADLRTGIRGAVGRPPLTTHDTPQEEPMTAAERKEVDALKAALTEDRKTIEGLKAMLERVESRFVEPGLAAPVVDAAVTPSGEGYWLAAADGGVFCRGDAALHGSLADTKLASPVVSIEATATGLGYWLTSADGGVFAFGDADFHGTALTAG